VIDKTADNVGGLGVLVERRTLITGFSVVTVVDVNTFTIPNADTQIPEDAVFNTFEFVSEQRIFIAADYRRAKNVFARRRDTEPSLYIIFGPESVSKDRNVYNDAALTATAQNDMNLTYIPEVDLVEFAITKKDFMAEEKQQTVYSEVRPALRRAMQGHMFDDTDTVQVFAGVEISNGSVPENTGYYIHGFTYQIPYRISLDQGNTIRKSVSFRSILVNSTMFDNDGDLVSLEAELEA